MKISLTAEQMERLLVHLGNRLAEVACPRESDEMLVTELTIALRMARQQHESVLIEVKP